MAWPHPGVPALLGVPPLAPRYLLPLPPNAAAQAAKLRLLPVPLRAASPAAG